MPPVSDDGSASLTACRSIMDVAARLACYDKLPSTSVLKSGASAPVSVATDEKVLFKWSGSSDMQTRPFHVDGPWELQWNTSEGYFSATLHRTSGAESREALLANGTEAGSSSSYQPTGGDFYLGFQAGQPWSARVVSLPVSKIPESQSVTGEPLLKVSGDQSDLPPCNGSGASEDIKNLVENSPLGKTLNITVLHVGTITSRAIRDGMNICTAALITNGGDRSYDFQYYREDGEIYIFGVPHLD